MTTFNSRVENLGLSGIRKFMETASKYENVIGLTIGQPSFHVPNKVKEAAINAIEQNQTSYTVNKGLPLLRKEIAKWINERYGLLYDEEEIIVTVGASQALDIAIRSVFNEGDEVLLPCPIYPAYEPLLDLQGVKVTYLDTTNSKFKVTRELIENAWTNNTKGIILTYPSNPTGVTYTEDELRSLAEFLHEKSCFVIADEIYSEITYTQKHTSIAKMPFMKEKTIVINGLSKSHAMTGFRVGYTLAPLSITSQMLKVHQYNVSCATSIAQHAAIAALVHCQDDVLYMKNEYEIRKRFLCDRLTEMNIDFVEPDGAFYIFPSIKKFHMSSFEFCVRLLEEERLAVIPGDAFSSYGEGFIRLSYAYSLEELEEACKRLERFIASLT